MDVEETKAPEFGICQMTWAGAQNRLSLGLRSLIPSGMVLQEQPRNPWAGAVFLLEHWLSENTRSDAVLGLLPSTWSGVDRARCHHLFLGALRHFSRIERALAPWLSRQPRVRLRSILIVVGFELIENQGRDSVPQIVHHAVEQSKALASLNESKLVNAVVRKMATILAQQTPPPKLAQAAVLADYFSHPEWLVQRWLARFGAVPTRALLEWNQTPAPVYARWRNPAQPPSAEEAVWLKPTQWPEFFTVEPGHWREVEGALREGRLYLQDPSTRLAIDLLAPQPGEDILDGCASPGGKALALADRRAGKPGVLVAMDLPGPRIPRLQENAARAREADIRVVEGSLLDVSGESLQKARVPVQYDAVLLDVPCSNTGVMRHRVDVRWRLRPDDIEKHGRQQLNFLRAGAQRVKPGGRLVYSTCSLDAAENLEVAEAFVRAEQGRFALEDSRLSLPWETGCDGAGAFLLRRTKA